MIAAAIAVIAVAGGGGAWYVLSKPSASSPTGITPTTPPPPPPVATEPQQAAQVTAPSTPTPIPTPQAPAAPAQPAPQPDSQQTAAISLGGLRSQIAQWVTDQHCSLLGGALSDSGAITLAGYAGDTSVDQMRMGLASLVPSAHVNWQVEGVNKVFCPALDLLQPTVPAFGATGVSRLVLQMADNKAQLHDGEQVRVHMVMPDFSGRLRVDYIAHDGSVQHLYPQNADTKNGITADGPRIWAAGQIINLANPAWTISAPYGTDMIIAVASSQPLFDKPRPNNAEQAATYLHELQATIDAARQRGEHVAGAALTLDALPK